MTLYLYFLIEIKRCGITVPIVLAISYKNIRVKRIVDAKNAS
jgi:hypothetical protein